ncbi:hypothetical protein HNQ78_000789 [Phycisphaera mikurensis]|nr:hypothetical protein [Phycisphaera mikurensis]
MTLRTLFAPAAWAARHAARHPRRLKIVLLAVATYLALC